MTEVRREEGRHTREVIFLMACTQDSLKDVSLIQVKHITKTSQSRVTICSRTYKQFISKTFSVMKTSFEPFLFTTCYKDTTSEGSLKYQTAHLSPRLIPVRHRKSSQ